MLHGNAGASRSARGVRRVRRSRPESGIGFIVQSCLSSASPHCERPPLVAAGLPSYDPRMPNLPSIVIFASWVAFVVTWAIAALFVKRTVERRWGWGRILILLAFLSYWAVR